MINDGISSFFFFGIHVRITNIYIYIYIYYVQEQQVAKAAHKPLDYVNSDPINAIKHKAPIHANIAQIT